MAKRYSGDLTITVTWDDRGYYRATVARKGRNLWRGTIGAPRHLEHPVDSAKAYDGTARAALSFASSEGVGVDDHAEHTGSGYKIERTPR